MNEQLFGSYMCAVPKGISIVYYIYVVSIDRASVEEAIAYAGDYMLANVNS